MGDLEQQRASPTEEEHPLSADPAQPAVAAKEALVSGREVVQAGELEKLRIALGKPRRGLGHGSNVARLARGPSARDTHGG
jgi:hypothetical protein